LLDLLQANEYIGSAELTPLEELPAALRLGGGWQPRRLMSTHTFHKLDLIGEVNPATRTSARVSECRLVSGAVRMPHRAIAVSSLLEANPCTRPGR
jgi:hypothetical protein